MLCVNIQYCVYTCSRSYCGELNVTLVLLSLVATFVLVSFVFEWIAVESWISECVYK